mmetsp:Transcript_26080/g.52294  ORF Transcript_26080/g.52294 Transcript_26080/m.52294 type:complete len:222 (+) Transcript_26080:179-844(+)
MPTRHAHMGLSPLPATAAGQFVPLCHCASPLSLSTKIARPMHTYAQVYKLTVGTLGRLATKWHTATPHRQANDIRVSARVSLVDARIYMSVVSSEREAFSSWTADEGGEAVGGGGRKDVVGGAGFVGVGEEGEAAEGAGAPALPLPMGREASSVPASSSTPSEALADAVMFGRCGVWPLFAHVAKLKRHWGQEESWSNHLLTHCSWNRCSQGRRMSVSSGS